MKQSKAKVVKQLKKLLGKNSVIDYERNSSHYHCWSQNQPPACGQKLEDHKQCCLCNTPYKPRKKVVKKVKDRRSDCCNSSIFHTGRAITTPKNKKDYGSWVCDNCENWCTFHLVTISPIISSKRK